MAVGMVYQVTDRGHSKHKVRKGDLVICLEETGDCFYRWAKLKKVPGTSTFLVGKPYDEYQSGNWIEKRESPITLETLLRNQTIVVPEKG